MHTKKCTPKVAILLSTYNGHRYIKEQLDSLLAQDYYEISICVRDDGSTDSTVEILREYAAKDDRIILTEGHNLGCAGSFFNLLCSTDAEIFMFCDQDDIWLSKKVSNAVTALVSAGLERSLLYHTDLVVVDEALQTLSSSFMVHQGIQIPQAHTLEVLSLQNCVVGCTVAMTAALVREVKISKELMDGAAMHDWWLALFACCKGTLIYSQQAEILYRQHGANVSGASRRSWFEGIRFQLSSNGVKRINSYRCKVSRQASEFVAKYSAELSLSQRKILEKVIHLDPKFGFLSVLKSQLSGIRFQNTYMNIAILYSAFVTQLSSLHTRRLH